MLSRRRIGIVLIAVGVTWGDSGGAGRAGQAAAQDAAQDAPCQVVKESAAERDARMKWWRDARFGMFIHWGVYAIPAGQWQGQPVGTAGEWIMDGANIPVAEYEKFAPQFRPLKYDPQAWARAARDAGVKYVVITSKHHDGFCLFDTRATTWDVVDATPHAKDLLKPLADACRAEGIRFCAYYSIMDWHHPAQLPADARHYNPTRIKPDRKREYIDFMKVQLRELLDSCNAEVLWFDGEWPDWWTEEDGRDLYDYLRQIRPAIIINNRIGKGRQGMEGMNKEDRSYTGDFGTPEQQIPATGFAAGVDWESCMTMNDTWGFRQDDHHWKSAETLIRNLIDTSSKGGNYLLNVGPTAEGLVPQPSLERLAAMGRWMKVNADSIYGTEPNPLAATPWGRCTRKTLEGGKVRLFLHVFDWPSDRQLTVPGIPSMPLRACLLAQPDHPLPVTHQESTCTVTLPESMPDPIATVIAVDLEGPLPTIEPAP